MGENTPRVNTAETLLCSCRTPFPFPSSPTTRQYFLTSPAIQCRRETELWPRSGGGHDVCHLWAWSPNLLLFLFSHLLAGCRGSSENSDSLGEKRATTWHRSLGPGPIDLHLTVTSVRNKMVLY